MGAPFAYQGTVASVAASYTDAADKRCVPLMIAFVPSFQDTCNVVLEGVAKFDQISTLEIDNSDSAGRTIVTFAGSNQNIIADAYTRGFYPVAANSKSFTVVSQSPTACSVNVNAYNFRINPFINDPVPTALGDQDIIAAVRSGTLSSSADVGTAQIGVSLLGVFTGGPYYYLTHLNLTIGGNFPALGGLTITLGDYDPTTLALRKPFFINVVTYPNGYLPPTTLLEFSDMNLYGTGQLGMLIGNPVSGGIINVNAVGGVSQSFP